MNALRHYMDKYDQTFGSGNGYMNAPNGSISQLGAVPVRDGAIGARRMMWAQQQMQREQQPQGAPDYFADTEGFQTRPQAPMQAPQGNGMDPQIRNYLARLFGGR